MTSSSGIPLSELDENIRKLILSKAKADTGAKTHKSWVDPISAQHVLGAIRAHKPVVTLRHGTFDIHYKANGKIWLQPKEGFIPCGYYSEESLEKIILEAALEDDSTGTTSGS